ncbi:MAG: lycopene cyclase domain-containing protein [Actinobacteria bacterium]|nr:lycopene cyclase domain-containing protein [Actinomycetota bacterium]
MLLFVIVGSWWLEFAFKLRVLRRPRILVTAIVPVSIFFLMWDAFAINQNHWTFDSEQILGIFGPLNIPLEEYLFFLIIPMAAVLTLEGVKVVMEKVKR